MQNDAVEHKDYGYDIVWVKKDSYYSKISVFEKKYKSNISFHKNTSKSWFVNFGNFKVTWIDTVDGKIYSQDLKEGSVFHIAPFCPVGIECLDDKGSITESGDILNIDDIHHVIASENIR